MLSIRSRFLVENLFIVYSVAQVVFTYKLFSFSLEIYSSLKRVLGINFFFVHFESLLLALYDFALLSRCETLTSLLFSFNNFYFRDFCFALFFGGFVFDP